MLKAILQLEAQGECRESATEAVLMVGYTTEGIFNQKQTRWLSWNVDGGVRGFDLARNPGLNNTTAYGAGEFPLPNRPPVGSAGQSTSRPLSMIRSQLTEEAYPDLRSLKRELERAPRILVDKAFSVPKCVRLARMSHHSHRLLKKFLGTVPWNKEMT